MKKLALVLIGLILIANIGFAIDTEFSLVCLGPGGNQLGKQKIFEEHVKPINEIFEMNADLSDLEYTASTGYTGEFSANIMATKISTSTPANGVRYEIIRDGEIVNSQSTTIQQGDTIRLSPEIEIGSDWIVEGASVDSPPITVLGHQEYNTLRGRLLGEFNRKYPNSNWYRVSSDYPPFSTETTEFNETGLFYLADNGYPAYLIPIQGGKKAGVQIFNLTSLYGTNCEKINNSIECTVTQDGQLPITFSNQSIVNVDKIIIGNTAIDADWVTEYGKTAATSTDTYPRTTKFTIPLELQIIPPGEQAPIAVIDCNGNLCDGNSSYDPDGEIVEYRWNTNNHYYHACLNYYLTTTYNAGSTGQPASNISACYMANGVYFGWEAITLTLQVTDNDGHTGKATKTLKFDDSGHAIQETFTLAADYNPSTQMSKITAECEGVVVLDIEEATEGKTELEKAEIPCNETTEIGPFTEKKSYRVIGSNNEEAKEAIFAVN